MKICNGLCCVQEYTMRTHKTTRSTMTTSIETGFTRGFDMSVKLASPCQVRTTTCTVRAGSYQSRVLGIHGYGSYICQLLPPNRLTVIMNFLHQGFRKLSSDSRDWYYYTTPLRGWSNIKANMVISSGVFVNLELGERSEVLVLSPFLFFPFSLSPSSPSLRLLFPPSLTLSFPLLALPSRPSSWGSAVSSPSGVGVEPQPKSHSVHFSFKIWHLVTTVSIIFVRINLPRLRISLQAYTWGERYCITVINTVPPRPDIIWGTAFPLDCTTGYFWM